MSMQVVYYKFIPYLMSDKARTKILIAKGLFSAFQGQYNYNTPKLHKIKIKTLRVNIFIHVSKNKI